jgi:hypothetical protein
VSSLGSWLKSETQVTSYNNFQLMSRDPKDAGSNDKFSGIRAGDVNYGSVENHGATTGHVIGDGNTIIGMRQR